jgi:hypothetical protein
MNPNYTIFVLVLRAVFLLTTVLTFLIFLKRQRNASPIFEQKVVFLLSVAVIMFNDPYYFLEVFRPSLFFLFVSTFLVVGFFIILMLCWICMLQKIRATSQRRDFFLSLKTKIIYGVITLGYLSIMLGFLYEITYYSYTESPIIPMHAGLDRLYLAMAVLLGILFLYIGWLYLGIIS